MKPVKKEKKEKNENKIKPGFTPGILFLLNFLEDAMKNYVFEDSEICNFQFQANPETFRGWHDGFIVDGLLAVCNEEGTKSFEASLYFFPVAKAEDFEANFFQEYRDWWLELKEPSLEILVEDGRLKVVKAEEV